MKEKSENRDLVAKNSLMESGVEKMIRVIRGKQVLLDRNLASLYGRGDEGSEPSGKTQY
ncbi:hypothetical protein [uncultured Fibrobacter sp.]|uniref:hypothetical protein n=1 Tax=uncultured Fibrobacter sp. TaxID=261512 RepID=UPI0025FC48AC|nr:hypothetical protein [uncultured Fibrobacter sp.]